MYGCYDPECSCPSCDGQSDSEPTLADECREILIGEYPLEDRLLYDGAMIDYELRVLNHTLETTLARLKGLGY